MIIELGKATSETKQNSGPPITGSPVNTGHNPL